MKRQFKQALGALLLRRHKLIQQHDPLPVFGGTCVYAYRAAESNRVTSAEYRGLIGAVVLGMLFFAEQPDMRFYLGSVLIVVPLTLLTLRSSSAAS